MLIKYKKNLEKIAMGLLSFMPEEKDIKKLQETIKEYNTNPDWSLYLWKEEDILGAIGIKIEEENLVIQHISVNPSYREQGIGKKMVLDIKKKYTGQYTIHPDDMTEEFYSKCKE